MYGTDEPRSGTPETDITLYVNYTYRNLKIDNKNYNPLNNTRICEFIVMLTNGGNSINKCRWNNGIRRYSFGKIDSEKNQQWMLKLAGENLRSNRIFTVSKYFSRRHLLVTKEKIMTLQWRNQAESL